MQPVVISLDPDAVYPDELPFHPAAEYPEYAFPGKPLSEANDVYELVRSTLKNLRGEGFGTPEWNPLGAWIRPGQTVLIKPNLVIHEHPKGGDLLCLITHGSVVRALLDYVTIALKGQGRVILGDAPLQGTDFQTAAERSGLSAVVDAYRDLLDIRLVDFRQVHAVKDRHGQIAEWKEVTGDPAGYVEFDLGEDSALAPIAGDSDKFRVAKYRAEDTRRYHDVNTHRYVVAGSVTDADVVIGVPKLKTHCKVGVTLGLKNFVGIVGRKQCLAHHRDGGAGEGGDEYPGRSRLKRFSVKLNQWVHGNRNPAARELLNLALRVDYRLMKSLGVDFILDGEWHGNDTCWRMVHDLNRIVRYGKGDGTFSDQPQRPVLTFLDGIVAGEENGPLVARPKSAGCLVAGEDPLAVDITACAYMGFDYRKIPLLKHGEPDDTRVVINDQPCTWAQLPSLAFKAPPGWAGHMEREQHADPVR